MPQGLRGVVSGSDRGGWADCENLQGGVPPTLGAA